MGTPWRKILLGVAVAATLLAGTAVARAAATSDDRSTTPVVGSTDDRHAVEAFQAFTASSHDDSDDHGPDHRLCHDDSDDHGPDHHLRHDEGDDHGWDD